jgi:GTPase SAR1 family protein
LSSRKSFENIESWVKSVKESTDIDPIMILVGTQMDLERYYSDYLSRTVTKDEALALVQRLGFSCYLECSAKNNEGIQEVITVDQDFQHDCKRDC